MGDEIKCQRKKVGYCPVRSVAINYMLSCAQQAGADEEILLIYNNLADKVYYIL